jgi:hypothetical protein
MLETHPWLYANGKHSDCDSWQHFQGWNPLPKCAAAVR